MLKDERFGKKQLNVTAGATYADVDQKFSKTDNITFTPPGIIGPPGMDPRIVKKLHAAFKKAWETPEMQAFYKKEGKDPVYKNSKDFKASVSADFDAMGETIKQLGLVKK